ncbi:hypothetical protein VTJ49DRAFT_6211 [Mycothermus thermophilus]|uniref:Uncharacterized protein n=1 Tax=Humicola insolens TaxID=85995 RepID=A0ABR3V323_HUMIN
MSYISNEPDASRPTPAGTADHDAVAVASSAETSSSSRSGVVDLHLPPPDAAVAVAVAIDISPSEPSSASKQASNPVSLPSSVWSFQRSTLPSASLASSTAEGRPVPITDTPGRAHPSSALQKLNTKYPSAARRQGQTPTNPSSQTAIYSQPVIVRTYTGPTPSQGSRGTHSRHYRPSGGVSRRPPLLSSNSAPGALDGPGRPIQPAVTSVGVGTITSSNAETSGDNAHLVNMPPPQSYSAGKASGGSGTKLPGGLSLSLPWPFSSREENDNPKLPPLEAFSFKSFMTDLEAPGDNSISADLDRIAEICARSRYSLSNQYEVHVPPHGSGESFLSSPPVPSSTPSRKGHSRDHSGGLTLQVVPSDDESLLTRSGHHRRRNPAARRRSVAYSTLETIMSSSRSSEEDKSKKKSAADLVNEVRGKVAEREARTDVAISNPAESQKSSSNPALVRRKSSSFAAVILDTAGGSSSDKQTTASSSSTSSHRRNHQPPLQATASSSLQSLLGEPARRQTSGTTSTPTPSHCDGPNTRRNNSSTRRRAATVGAAAAYRPTPNPERGSQVVDQSLAYSSSWTSWIPWPTGTGGGATGGAGAGASGRSCAEGSLRQLLRDRR